jgi:hypothetical protein
LTAVRKINDIKWMNDSLEIKLALVAETVKPAWQDEI